MIKISMVNDYLVLIPSDDDVMSFLHISLKPKGITDHFTVRTVTLADYKSNNASKFQLTVEAPDWNLNGHYIPSRRIVCLIIGNILSTLLQQQWDKSQCS